MSTLKVSTISPLGTDATKTITIGSAGDTAAGVFTNTPSFCGYQSSTQSIGNASWTKLTFDTERWDTNSAFDLTNSKFTVPSNLAGKYQISAHTEIPGVDANERAILAIYKNGSRVEESQVNEQKASADRTVQLTNIITLDLSVDDYIEAYVYQDSGDSQNSLRNWLDGNLLIGA